MSQFDDKAAAKEAEAFDYQHDSGVYPFICGAHWQHSQLAAKIAELESQLELLSRISDGDGSWLLNLYDQRDQLAEKLRVATEALQEASEWNDVDDINSEAARICKQALEKIRGEK